MSEYTDETLITGHEYDGIQEYDNPVPGWWHVLWIGSFVLAIVYLPVSLISPFFTHPTERLEAAQQAEFQRLFAEVGDLENDPATLVSLMNDEAWMSFAEGTFRKSCASCHAADGGGLIGPNMTDDHYKNVTELTDFYTVIADGAANGAMPAWGNRLHPNEIVLLSAYAASLRGTEPGSPTDPEPEAQVVPPWPTAEEVGAPESLSGESADAAS